MKSSRVSYVEVDGSYVTPSDLGVPAKSAINVGDKVTTDAGETFQVSAIEKDYDRPGKYVAKTDAQ